MNAGNSVVKYEVCHAALFQFWNGRSDNYAFICPFTSCIWNIKDHVEHTKKLYPVWKPWKTITVKSQRLYDTFGKGAVTVWSPTSEKRHTRVQVFSKDGSAINATLTSDAKKYKCPMFRCKARFIAEMEGQLELYFVVRRIIKVVETLLTTVDYVLWDCWSR